MTRATFASVAITVIGVVIALLLQYDSFRIEGKAPSQAQFSFPPAGGIAFGLLAGNLLLYSGRCRSIDEFLGVARLFLLGLATVMLTQAVVLYLLDFPTGPARLLGLIMLGAFPIALLVGYGCYRRRWKP